MPGVRCEVMCKAWTPVPDALCEVRSSVCVLPGVCGTVRGMGFCARSAFPCQMLCARYGVLSYVLREVYGSVSCPARGMELSVRYSVLGMEFCVRCSA